MQFIGRLGNLLDGIDENTSPKNNEASPKGAYDTTSLDDERKPAEVSHAPGGGLMGRGFGFLSSAAGNVTGSLRELVSDEGGGGSLEAKIAAWDPFGIIDDKDSMRHDTGDDDKTTQHKVKPGSQDPSKSVVLASQSGSKARKLSDDEDLFGGWDSDSDGVEKTRADSPHKLEVAEQKHETIFSDLVENVTLESPHHVESDRDEAAIGSINADLPLAEEELDQSKTCLWDSDSDGVEETRADSQHKLEVVEQKHETVLSDLVENVTGESPHDVESEREEACQVMEHPQEAAIGSINADLPLAEEDHKADLVCVAGTENATDGEDLFDGWDDIEAPAKDPDRNAAFSAANVRESPDSKASIDIAELHASHETPQDSISAVQDTGLASAECFDGNGESNRCKEDKSTATENQKAACEETRLKDLSARRAELARTQEKINDRRRKLQAAAKADISRGKAEVERLQTESSSGAEQNELHRLAAQTEVASLKQDIERLQQDALGKAQQHETSTTEIANLKGALEQQTAAVSEAKEEIAKLQSEEAIAKLQALLKEQKAAAQEELAKAKAELESLQAEVSAGAEQEDRQLAAARTETAYLKQEVEKMRLAASQNADQHSASTMVANEEVLKLRTALEQETAAVSEAKIAAHEETARLQSSMNEQQASAQKELSKAKAELESLQMEVSSGTEQHDQQLIVAQADISSLKQEIERLQAAASETTQHHALNTAVTDEEILRLKTSLEQQTAVVSQANTVAEEKKSKLQILMSEQQAAAQEELSSAKAELERLQMEASSGVEQKDQELVDAQTEIASSKQEIERLQGVASEKVQQHALIAAVVGDEISQLKSVVEHQTAALFEAKNSSQDEITTLQALMGQQQAAAQDELSKAKAELERLQGEVSFGVEQKEQQLGVVQAEVACLKQEIESLKLAASENMEQQASSTAAAIAADEEISRLMTALAQQQTAVSAEAQAASVSDMTTETMHAELSKSTASSAQHNKRADLAETSLAQLQEEYARLQASTSQTFPQGAEGKLVELERERESLIARVSDAEGRARDAERRFEQMLKDDSSSHGPSDNRLRSVVGSDSSPQGKSQPLEIGPSDSRVRSVVGSDSAPKGKSQPLEIDLETGTRSKPSDSGCGHEADRPLQFIARQLSASQLWRRVFFSYLLLLHLWTFFILHRHSGHS